MPSNSPFVLSTNIIGHFWFINMEKNYFSTLLRSNNSVFTFKELSLIWNETDVKLTKKRVYRYMKMGELYPIRKGVYAKDKNYDKLELANKIFTPAYEQSTAISSCHRERSVAISPCHRERSVAISPCHHEERSDVVISPCHHERSVAISPCHHEERSDVVISLCHCERSAAIS